jgi:hypothetical protein
VKAKGLSMLIVDQDQLMQQLLAAFLAERYGSVTVTTPQAIRGPIALKSYDVMVAPKSSMHLSADDTNNSKEREGFATVAVIRSGVSGNLYEFRSLKQEASDCVSNPFERVLLQVAIEKSELFLEKLKRFNKNTTLF